MISTYEEQRKHEYLSGTRSWESGSLTDNDYDRFTREYVVPLRQLKRNGLFASFEEVMNAINGAEVRTTEIFVS